MKSCVTFMMALAAVMLALVAISNNVNADIPVHCLFSQVKGEWELQLTRSGETRDIVHVCTLESPLEEIETKIRVNLDTPDIIRDETGKNIGAWTLIYDQGFELSFGGNKYFAFFNYTKDGDDTISHCDRTFTGTYHTNEVNSQNWGCFRAVKTSSNPLIKMKNVRKHKPLPAAAFTSKFTNDANYIQKINDAKLGWTARAYPQFAGKTVAEMQRMAGNRVDRERFTAMKHFGALAKGLKKNSQKKNLNLPTNFDWRNVNGINYITPVRNQGGCGSCYVFATLGAIEARVAIKSKGQQRPTLSPQDVVSCCTYSQGCDGGFPYLVSKYGEDFGLTTENCDPYVAQDTKCSNTCPANQTRLYTSDFYYVGGYYGATDEQSMMEELYTNGPVAIAFQVYRDFYSYSGGIYRHVSALSEAAPEPGWEEVNHGVLLVGWGVENGTKYWIMKNSWGDSWGDKGYFKIVRGEDNAACESLAVAATPYAYL